ncbi:MAG TPA: hypothetical protein GX506_12390 [Firmicutes bacterium]|nr:hypothetical protein [Bacillota bacterium]
MSIVRVHMRRCSYIAGRLHPRHKSKNSRPRRKRITPVPAAILVSSLIVALAAISVSPVHGKEARHDERALATAPPPLVPQLALAPQLGSVMLENGQALLDLGTVSPLSSPAIWTRAIHLDVVSPGTAWSLFIQGSGDLVAGGGTKRIPLSRLKFASSVGPACYGSPWWRPLSTTQAFVAGQLATGSPHRTELWVDLRLDVTWDDIATAPGERYRTNIICTLTDGELINNYVYPNPFCPARDGSILIYYYHSGSPSYPRILTCSIRNSSGQLVFPASVTVPQDAMWVSFSWHGKDTASRQVPDGIYTFTVTDNQEPGRILTAGTITLINALPGSGTSGIAGRVVDSRTGRGLADARIHLFTSGRKEVTSRLSATDGSFRFDGLPAGDYYVEVWLPGYTPYTSPLYRLASGQNRPITISLTPNSAIYLVAEATPQQASPGDIVTFNAVIENVGTRPLREVLIENASGYPFASFPSTSLLSTSRGKGDSWQLKKPGLPTQRLESIEIGQKKTVTFKVIVLPDAPPGAYLGCIKATAMAQGPGGSAEKVEAGPVFPRVQVLPGIFNDSGAIAGRAYIDLNENRMHDPGEPPAGGAVVALANGERTKTDEEGRFLFTGLRPGVHGLKPVQGSEPTWPVAGEPVMVDVPRGGAATIDIPVRPQPGDKQGSGNGDMDNAIGSPPGHKGVTRKRDSQVEVDVLAAAEVKVDLDGSPGLGGLSMPGRPPGSGGPSLPDAPSLPGPSPIPDGWPVTGRASGSVTVRQTGAIEYELSVAYDSEGSTRGMELIPAMEDVVDRVASVLTSTYRIPAGPLDPFPHRLSLSGRAGIPVGPGKLTLTIGSLGTSAKPLHSVPSASPSLVSVNGLGLQYSVEDVTLGVFLGKPDTAHFMERIPGKDAAGPYFLQNSPVVQGSEDISVKTYDKVNGSVLRTITPRYTIEYSTGRITFDRTIARSDQDGNPVMVVASYEAALPPGAAAPLAAGGQFSLKRLDPGGSTGFAMDFGMAVPGQVRAGLTIMPDRRVAITGTYEHLVGDAIPGHKEPGRGREGWAVGVTARPTPGIETWLKGTGTGPDGPERGYETGVSFRLGDEKSLTLRKMADMTSIAYSNGPLQLSLRHTQGGGDAAEPSRMPGLPTTSLSISTALPLGKMLRLSPSVDLSWHPPWPEPKTTRPAIGLGLETTREGPVEFRGVYQKNLSGYGHSSVDLDLKAIPRPDLSAAAKLSLGNTAEGYRRDMKLALDWRPVAERDLLSLAYLRVLDLAGKDPYSLLEGSCLIAGRLGSALSLSCRVSKKTATEGVSALTARTDMYAARAVLEFTPRIHLMADYIFTQQHESNSIKRQKALELIGAVTDRLHLGVGWASDSGPYIRLALIAGGHWYTYHTESPHQGRAFR